MDEDETVTVTSLGPATTQARARRHSFVIDKLPHSGGMDRAPMSSEYLLGALGSCQITTAYKVAAKRKLRLDRVDVTSTGSFKDGLFTSIKLDIHVQGSGTAEDWDTVFRLVERICTISQALRVPIVRTVGFG